MSREPKDPSAPASPSRYIVSPRYDWFFFLLPPMMALALGMLVSGTNFADREWEFWDQDVTNSALLTGIFTHAHIVIVFFRSHGNPDILKLYRGRFLVVPPLLFLAMMSSNWVLIAVSVLVTKLRRAAVRHPVKSLCIGGGVARNSRLRERLQGDRVLSALHLVLPELTLCSDNGAMVASLGSHLYRAGQIAPLDLDAVATSQAGGKAKRPRPARPGKGR